MKYPLKKKDSVILISFSEVKIDDLNTNEVDPSEVDQKSPPSLLIFRTTLDCAQLPDESFFTFDAEAVAQDGSVCTIRLKVHSLFKHYDIEIIIF